MTEDSLYATPRDVSSLDDCIFYHTLDIPGHGHVEGYWDLRGTEHTYLGGVDFGGQRVLEVGPASGHLSFFMERQGAEVVSVDLSEDHCWDMVPFSRAHFESTIPEVKDGIRKLNNGYWLNHKAVGSKAKVVYTPVYDVPAAIGPVNISTFSAVLVHFENPFRALEGALKLTKDKVIITEVIGRKGYWLHKLSPFKRRRMTFMPDWRKTHGFQNPLAPDDLEECMSWWLLTPDLVKEFLGCFGFEKTEIKFHQHLCRGRKVYCYSMVGYRTQPMPGS